MKKQKVLTVIISILLLISILSGGLLVVYTYSLRRASNDFNDLAKVFQDSQIKTNKMNKNNPKLPLPSDDSREEELEVTIDFETLYNKNNDIVAWISIPGTRLNYPVMHTPQKPEYYLYRNFNKEYSTSGVPFIDGRSSLEKPSDNILIHGHNMKNGSMFAQLLSYKDEDFLKEHPSIEFYTHLGKETYDIISVFPTEAYNATKSNFNYYDFINAKDQEDFDRYVTKVKELSIFDTGIGAKYGEQLMTLSTCAYHTTNGRFVVIGKSKGNK